MAQSKPLNDEAASHRPLTPFSSYKRAFRITDDLPAVVQIEKLCGLFTVLAAGTHAISDNLQPGELKKRITRHKGVPSSPAEMKVLLQEDEHAVELLHDCLEAMRAPLTQIDGACAAFEECSKVYLREKRRLSTGRKALAAILQSPTSQNSNDQGSGLTPLVA